MVLINGSGVVKAGQWARRLIINNGVKYGTMLPYIEMAKDRGYEIIVMVRTGMDSSIQLLLRVFIRQGSRST